MSTKENAIIEKVVMRPLADLVPNPKNPRTAQDEDIAALAESIKANPRFFVARPILLSDRTGVLMIIAGERRSEAARLLGMTEVPTILLSGLTEAQEDEIMVRDNTHAGKWDGAKLKSIAEAWGADTVGRWAPGVSWELPRAMPSPEANAEGDDFAYQPKFGVIVVCAGEREQQEVYERLTAEGFECKVVSV